MTNKKRKEKGKYLLYQRSNLPKLRKTQMVLFNVICKKLKANTELTFEETKKMYIDTACRNFVDGKPAFYNYYWNRKEDDKGNFIGYDSRYEVMPEEYLRRTILIWLTHNIGVLVLKGYLKVLPVIELV
jgi:hypothetical protein